MHHMKRRTRGRRVGQHLLQRRKKIAAHHSRLPDVGEHRCLVLRSQLEHRVDLRVIGTGHVGDAGPDPQATLTQTSLEQRHQLSALRLREPLVGVAVRTLRWQRLHHINGVSYFRAGDHLDAGREMARGGAVIDPRLALARFQPLRDRKHADLELERRGHTIGHLKIVAPRILTVRVQIDEAWRDDQTRHVDLHIAGKRPLADRHDGSVLHRDIAHRVQARRRVHHRAADQHQIIAPRGTGHHPAAQQHQHPDSVHPHPPHSACP